jgi:DNA ligase-1
MNEQEIYRAHDRFVARGFEGAIVRNLHGKYKFKHRSKDLQKVKVFVDTEFTIVDGYPGTGTEEGCVTFEVIPDPKVTDGYDQMKKDKFGVRPRGTREQRRWWMDNIEEMKGKFLTVRYQELSEEGVPIFPVGLAVRDYE